MPRLFIDVTRSLQSGLHTGIQRVVRRLLDALRRAGPAQAFPAVFDGEHWYALSHLPPHALEAVTAPDTPPARERIAFSAADTLLLADASWYLDPWPAVDAALDAGARLCGMVHDLLPLHHPEWFRPGLQPRFARHLEQLARRASQLFVPSAAVRAQLEARLTPPARPRITVLAHGGNFFRPTPPLAGAMIAPPALQHLLTTDAPPFYLALGTLEPRKNHHTILDAFDTLWQRGCEQRLVLVGTPGWQVDALLARIATHPELGQRLFHLTGLDDAHLGLLYRHAQALLYLSLDEGFGLPVLEAAHLGCPVITSDIPVLRETGGDWPCYIDPASPAALIAALLARTQPRPPAVPRRTWADVAGQLLLELELPVALPSLLAG